MGGGGSFDGASAASTDAYERVTAPAFLSGTRRRSRRTLGGKTERGADEHTVGGAFREHVTTLPRAWRQGVRSTIYSVAGDEYTGEWQHDLKHGRGVQIWANGDRYEGMWQDDVRQGAGSFWRAVVAGEKDDASAAGAAQPAAAASVLSLAREPSGARPGSQAAEPELFLEYVGNWARDRRHGLGTGYWPNGDSYEGEWRDGRRHGWGTMTYACGERYEGEWVADERAGFGKLFLANGHIYEGSWAADVKDGPGRMYYVARNKVYEGEWLMGEAKCGVIVDIERASNAGERRLGLPVLGLAGETVAAMLQQQVDQIANMREELLAQRAEIAAMQREEEQRLHDAAEREARRIGNAKAIKRPDTKKKWLK